MAFFNLQESWEVLVVDKKPCRLGGAKIASLYYVNPPFFLGGVRDTLRDHPRFHFSGSLPVERNQPRSRNGINTMILHRRGAVPLNNAACCTSD